MSAPRFERTPGEAALLKVKLARARYETASLAFRLNTRCGFGGSDRGSPVRRQRVRAEYHQADAALKRALREMEALS